MTAQATKNIHAVAEGWGAPSNEEGTSAPDAIDTASCHRGPMPALTRDASPCPRTRAPDSHRIASQIAGSVITPTGRLVWISADLRVVHAYRSGLFPCSNGVTLIIGQAGHPVPIGGAIVTGTVASVPGSPSIRPAAPGHPSPFTDWS